MTLSTKQQARHDTLLEAYKAAYPSTPPSPQNITFAVMEMLTRMLKHPNGFAALSEGEEKFFRFVARDYSEMVNIAHAGEISKRTRSPLIVRENRDVLGQARIGISGKDTSTFINAYLRECARIFGTDMNFKNRFMVVPLTRDIPVMLAEGKQEDGSCRLTPEQAEKYFSDDKNLKSFVQRINRDLGKNVMGKIEVDKKGNLAIPARAVRDMESFYAKEKEILPTLDLTQPIFYFPTGLPSIVDKAAGYPELIEWLHQFHMVVMHKEGDDRVTSLSGLQPQQTLKAIAQIFPEIAERIEVRGHDLHMSEEDFTQLVRTVEQMVVDVYHNNPAKAEQHLHAKRGGATEEPPAPSYDETLKAADIFMEPLLPLLSMSDLVENVREKYAHKPRVITRNGEEVRLLRYRSRQAVEKTADQLNAFIDHPDVTPVSASTGEKGPHWLEIPSSSWNEMISTGTRLSGELKETGTAHMNGKLEVAEKGREKLKGHLDRYTQRLEATPTGGRD